MLCEGTIILYCVMLREKECRSAALGDHPAALTIQSVTVDTGHGQVHSHGDSVVFPVAETI